MGQNIMQLLARVKHSVIVREQISGLNLRLKFKFSGLIKSLNLSILLPKYQVNEQANTVIPLAQAVFVNQGRFGSSNSPVLKRTQVKKNNNMMSIIKCLGSLQVLLNLITFAVIVDESATLFSR